MNAVIFWTPFVAGAALVLGPGVVNPYAPFNGLSMIGVAILFAATLFAVLKGGEQDDD